MLKHILFFAFALFTIPLMAQNFDAEWQRIDKLNQEGKYRSALTAAESLYEKADQLDATDTKLKALFHRVNYLQILEERESMAVVELLRSELDKKQSPAFHAVAAHLLGRMIYTYANNNSYQLNERTGLLELEANWEKPLAEWSLNALYKTGTDYLLSAVEQARIAKTSLSKLPSIYEKGENLSDRIPDLYTAIVHLTLDELGSGYANLPEPVYAFNPDADLLFKKLKDFTKAKVETKDTEGLNYRRFRLYQQLLADQTTDRKQRAALVYTNLKRLEWAYQLTGDYEAYDEALKSFYTVAPKYTGAGMILMTRANLQMDQPALGQNPDDKEKFHALRALQLAEEVIKKYPDTQAEILARQLIERIKQPSLSVQVEEYLLPNQHNLASLNYQNVEKVYYRIYKKDFEPKQDRDYLEPKDIRRLARKEADYSGVVQIAANDDYLQHSTEFALPALVAGQYRLLLSASPDFDNTKGITLYKKLAVTNLATIIIGEKDKGISMLVERQSGAAIPNAKITLYPNHNRSRNGLGDPVYRTTDKLGRFELPVTNNRYTNTLLVVEHGQDKMAQTIYHSNYRSHSRPNESVHFFLDRGLYRPGQTLYAKGLAVKYDEDRSPSLLKNRNFTVFLNDANGQRVGEQEVKTDTYGAFNLSFLLPESGLNGHYNIHAAIGGNSSFRVEAYKRPRFEVTFDEYSKAIEAGTEVTISGKALGFAGPPVEGGKVTYRVVRETASYWYAYGNGANVEAVLATGTTTTNEDGCFDITFKVKVPQNNNGPAWRRPHYRFVVYADVADQTGETHAAKTAVSLKSKTPAVTITIPSTIDKAKATEQQVEVIYESTDDQATKIPATIRIDALRHPDPAVVKRYWTIPDRPTMSKSDFKKKFPLYAYEKTRQQDEWPLKRGIKVPGSNREIELGKDDNFSIPTAKFDVGHYLITLSYPDGEGGTAKTVKYFSVFDSEEGKLPKGQAFMLSANKTIVLAGETAQLKLLTADKFPMVISQLSSPKLDPTTTYLTNVKSPVLEHLVTKDDRGGLHYQLAFVRNNRFYELKHKFTVPWKSKQLQVSYESFRDKLRPGEAENWTLKLKDHNGNPISAQLLASMYDASLDAIAPFSWSNRINFYYTNFHSQNQLRTQSFGMNSAYGSYDYKRYYPNRNYTLPYLDFSPISFGYGGYGRVMYEMAAGAEMDESAPMMQRTTSAPPPPPPPSAPRPKKASAVSNAMADDSVQEESTTEPKIRTNLNETAFFLPEIRVDKDGVASIQFTTPEALTKWKLQLFAHTPELAYVYDTKEIVTQKELMILPNAPRFLREGDKLVFTAKVSNLSEKHLKGNATLEFFNPETEEIIKTIEVAMPDTNFELEAGKSQTVKWSVEVPQNSAGLVGYRVIARSGQFSDGEQNVLPVLTNRVFLTATKSFFLRPEQRKTIKLDALLNADKAAGDIVNKGYTFELTNNPAWLAVKALPYLTEYPYDCTEQLVNRFFANQLSHSIVKEKPALQQVYAKWQDDPDALKSPLASNQKLKQALLEETPWLREAQSEEKQQAQIAILFDLNRIAKEQQANLAKLEERQKGDGSFSWFPEGPENVYMTQYVVESLQRLNTLGALDQATSDRVATISRKTLDYLDKRWVEHYKELLKRQNKKLSPDYLPATSLVHYFYIRSFFLQENPLNNEAKKMWDFYYDHAKKGWTKYGLYEQALLAATYSRTEPAMGKMLIESLRERALRSEEFGMYWKYPAGFSWQQLPVETHCRIFEAFLLNGGTQNELDEMRLYLLQDKRTNRWETTKATAAAVHALLLNGTKWLDDDTQVAVNIPGIDPAKIAVAQSNAQAGTGQYQVSVAAESVQNEMGAVSLNNQKSTIAWGGIYWQFTQDIDAVQKQNENGPLGLTRKIFRRINTDAGQRLVAVDANNPIKPGDRLVVQLTIRSDRNFEYIHLKDRRASGLEPTKQLSGYRYEGGLGFYFSPDDLAVNFFFDYLPKGTHTLEYDLFVNHAGDFSNGLSVIQSMYAPEFAAYSQGSRLEVE